MATKRPRAQPKLMRPDDIDPKHRWDRPLQAPRDLVARVDLLRGARRHDVSAHGAAAGRAPGELVRPGPLLERRPPQPHPAVQFVRRDRGGLTDTRCRDGIRSSDDAPFRARGGGA